MNAARGEPSKIVLLVTSIVSGQPPSSYQVNFDSCEKCNAARDAVLGDRYRVVKGMAPDASWDTVSGGFGGMRRSMTICLFSLGFEMVRRIGVSATYIVHNGAAVSFLLYLMISHINANTG